MVEGLNVSSALSFLDTESQMPSRTLSAGVVVVRWVDGELRYLLLRIYKYWDFPKGKVEAGEKQIQAAEREVEEETTLSALEFSWGYVFRESGPYGPQKKVARYYIAESKEGEVSLPVNPELGRPEHHEFRWVTYEEARKLLNERLKPILDWAHARITIHDG